MKLFVSIKRCLFTMYQLVTFSAGKTKTYFTGDEKSSLSKFIDLLIWQIRERKFNSLYYTMGLNLKKSQVSDYIGQRELLQIKGNVECEILVHSGNSLNYDAILKDKFYAACIFQANNLPCLTHQGVIWQGHYLSTSGKRINLEDLFSDDSIELFIKNSVIEGGNGVLNCVKIGQDFYINGKSDSLAHLQLLTQKGVWVVQNRYRAHSMIETINDSALNILRIVTILDGETPRFLTGFQSFARATVTDDSWKNGSIYIGFDHITGHLHEKGFFSPWDKSGTLTAEHPDSRVQFASFKIPYFKDAIELCLKAHSILFYHFLIGWDIAITESGPVIVEANEKPGMNVVQCVDRGLRLSIRQAADRTIRQQYL